MFGYIMFLEKEKNKNELLEHLNIIINLCKSKEKLYELSDIVNYLLENVLQDEIRKELIPL